MKEYLIPIQKINEIITDVAKKISDKMAVRGKDAEELEKQVFELLKMIREMEARLLTAPFPKDELYQIGKVIGRLESTYAILVKAIENGRKRIQ
jgi:hypothetical protein